MDEQGGATRPLQRLDGELAERGLAAELCVVGGAVIRLVFAADPGSRRPDRLFADPAGLTEAEESVARDAGLPRGWLEATARETVTTRRGADRVFEGGHVRAFSAPPDYVLAMKCASLAFAPAPAVEDDIRYLLRYQGLRSGDAAMEVVDRYLTPRQRPADLATRLERLSG